jgi:hypothetical protein
MSFTEESSLFVHSDKLPFIYYDELFDKRKTLREKIENINFDNVSKDDSHIVTNKKYFTSTTMSKTTMASAKLFNTPVILKISYANKDIVNNSLDVEYQIYKSDVTKLIYNNNSPFLVECYGTYECDECVEKEGIDMIKQKLNSTNTYDLNKQKILILEKTQEITMFEFLKSLPPVKSDRPELLKSLPPVKSDRPELLKNTKDENELISVMFQILWTLQCFKRLKLKHNDLHFKNIFVDKVDKPVKFQFKYKEKQFSLTTNYIVKIFYFDRSCVYGNPAVSRNLFIDTICKTGAQCNYLNSKVDLWNVLCPLRFPESNFKNKFIYKVINMNSENIKLILSKKHGNILRFKTFLKDEDLKPVDQCIDILLNIDINSPFSFDDVDKSKLIISLPEKRGINLWNPSSTGIHESYPVVNSHKYDSENDVTKYNTNFNLIVKNIYTFEISLIPNYDIKEEYKKLIKAYVFKKQTTIIPDIAIACYLLSNSIYHQCVNNNKLEKITGFLSLFFDIKISEQSIWRYIDDIWNTFNGVLPIQIPHL